MKKIILIIAGIIIPTLCFSQFSAPESIAYYQKGNFFLVSNAGNGTISKFQTINQTSVFATGLAGPKGMCIIGDTLYVADISNLVAFDLISGTKLFTKSIPTSQFLNDLCTDGKGFLYVTDTQRSKIWKYDITTGESIFMSLSNNIIAPNGILYHNEKLYVVTFSNPGNFYEVDPLTNASKVLKSNLYAYLDGIQYDNKGKIYISAWNSTSQGGLGGIYSNSIADDFTSDFVTNAEKLNGPADFLFRDEVFYIPEMNANKITIEYLDNSPETPVLKSPSDGSFFDIPEQTFEWYSSDKAEEYEFLITHGNLTDEYIHTTKTELSISMVLPDLCTDYYWRVRAKNASGISNWSDTFKLQPGVLKKVQLISPVNNYILDNFGEGVLFECTKENSYYFNFEFDLTDKFDSPKKWSSGLLGSNKYILEVPSNWFLENTKFYWRVINKKCSNSTDSLFSDTYSFTTKTKTDYLPGKPELVSPEDGYDFSHDPDSPDLTWKPVKNATSYFIVYSKLKHSLYDTLFAKEIPARQLDKDKSGNYFWNPHNMEEWAYYYWQITSMNFTGKDSSETRKLWFHEFSVKEDIENNVINLFPNPSTGSFSFSSDVVMPPFKIDFFNFLGYQILSKITNETVFSVDLPTGVYLVRINNRWNKPVLISR